MSDHNLAVEKLQALITEAQNGVDLEEQKLEKRVQKLRDMRDLGYEDVDWVQICDTREYTGQVREAKGYLEGLKKALEIIQE